MRLWANKNSCKTSIAVHDLLCVYMLARVLLHKEKESLYRPVMDTVGKATLIQHAHSTELFHAFTLFCLKWYNVANFCTLTYFTNHDTTETPHLHVFIVANAAEREGTEWLGSRPIDIGNEVTTMADVKTDTGELSSSHIPTNKMNEILHKFSDTCTCIIISIKLNPPPCLCYACMRTQT